MTKTTQSEAKLKILEKIRILTEFRSKEQIDRLHLIRQRATRIGGK